ncbi:hypothetical protein B0H12DRAFT_309473 [Mycena haematopus]|nr:hypothetical protein B0H12DRAFT_309473 [Mycena haematopus]
MSQSISQQPTRLDILPLTRLLDIEHLRPSPAMTLHALRTRPPMLVNGSCMKPPQDPEQALVANITNLHQEVTYWKQRALLIRDFLQKSGIDAGQHWEREHGLH